MHESGKSQHAGIEQQQEISENALVLPDTMLLFDESNASELITRAAEGEFFKVTVEKIKKGLSKLFML